MKQRAHATTAHDLSIVIVNYNGQFWLKKTLLTLKEWVLNKTKFDIEVIVVDNGSHDDSLVMLKRQFRWVTVIALEQNVGFAAGNNVGLRHTKSRYVMLLNSDVESTAQTQLDELLFFLDEHPQVAVVTPKVELPNGQLDWACHRGEPTPWAALTYFSGLGKSFPKSPLFGQYHLTYLDLRQPHQVDACTGAAMIVKSSAMKQVGLLDEQFFFYAEDLDWCKRFRDAGWQVWYLPSSIVVHHKNKSGLSSQSVETRVKTRRYFYDTMLQYYDKHYRSNYPSWVRWGIQVFLFIKKGGV